MASDEKTVKPRRSYFFGMMLYPDDTSHKAFLDNLECMGFQWCGILHDKDAYAEDTELNGVMHANGEIKKAHVHLFIKLRCNKTLTAMQHIVGAYGVAPNYVQFADEFGLCTYLTHQGLPETPDKHHYAESEVFGSKVLYKRYAVLTGEDDFSILRNALNIFLSSSEYSPSYMDCMLCLNENGCLHIGGSNYLYSQLIKETILLKKTRDYIAEKHSNANALKKVYMEE